MKYFLCFIFLFFTTIANAQEKHSYKPEAGYVPDAETAISIAEAVLSPIYGKEKIIKERPFYAKLENGIWSVGGTLYCGEPPQKEGCLGGVAIAEISKDDGRTLRVSHGK